MNFKAMNMFLSEENIKNHIEHLRTLRLKYSVLEKSITELNGKGIGEVYKMGISRKIKDEAIELLWHIKSHDLFFNSFSEMVVWHDDIRKNNGSRESFVYNLLTLAERKKYGYIYVYLDRQKKITVSFADSFDGAFVKYEPRLCIDIFEHTYFNDYGFKKDKFIRGALAYLDTNKLS